MIKRPHDPEFGRRFDIAHARSKHSDLPQTDIAKMLKVSQQCISMWKSGVRLPSISQGRRLAELFGVCVEWLYTGRGPITPVDTSPFTDLAYRFMELDQSKLSIMKFLLGMLEKDVVKDITTIQDALNKLIMIDFDCTPDGGKSSPPSTKWQPW